MTSAHRSFRSRWFITAMLISVGCLYLVPLLAIVGTSIKPITQALSPTASPLPTVDDAAILEARLQRLLQEPTLNELEITAVRSRLETTRTQPSPRSIASAAYWRGLIRIASDVYRATWDNPAADFPIYLKNSLIVAILSVLGMTLSSAIVAYGFARLRWPGRDGVFGLVLLTMMIPFPVLMAPMYVLFKHLGWIGTLKPLWIPAWFGGAFSIFLLRQFYLTIPRELDEAAMLDGCSDLGILRHVIIPLARPALVVVALFQFIASWNDFVGPLIFLNHQNTYTLSLGLYLFQNQHSATPWNLVMAASVITIMPVLLVFLLAQRSFVHGIAGTGLKA